MSRTYFPGIGQAVADRTVNRKGESWGDVAQRVAHGNALLDGPRFLSEYQSLNHHLDQASTLMSGRHLQHGDSEQPNRPQEVFTNCSTAMLRFLTFKLLLSGSGVGGSYDDNLMVVDWSASLPEVTVVLAPMHEDITNGFIKRNEYPTLVDAIGRAKALDREYEIFTVPDSREGWAQAIELMETRAFEGRRNLSLILDFSLVRGRNRPIKGMQNRPASGPKPLMDAIMNVASLRDSGFAPWKAAMYADHYLAECVLVGGARRAARIAVKYWKDSTIFEFIDVKRPDAFIGKSHVDIANLRQAAADEGDTWRYPSKLWSSNNSVAVDDEFWTALDRKDDHAVRVWNAVIAANYGDATGEPGFLNVSKLTTNDIDIEQYADGDFAGSNLYELSEGAKIMGRILARAVLAHPYHYIVNPCGEIVLFMLGGFCVISDVVPFHAANDDDAEDAFRVSARALMRVNTMDSIYRRETARTNRIGVGITGLHEYMWDRFGLGFRDAIAEGTEEIAPGLMGPTEDALPFWNMLKRFSDAVDDEVHAYALKLGVNVPHTWVTMKPAGTTSKLFGLTEAAHLPSRAKYLRWVQFRFDDPLVEEYKAKGYPFRELKSYSGTVIIGFPTAMTITQLGMGDKLVLAGEASPAEQFRWLKLLEHYWLQTRGANQISYTLKYRPSEVSFEQFDQIMRTEVRNVRAVSVLPELEVLSYEYQPEEPISDEAFELLVATIQAVAEDVDKVHVDCDNGACPVDFNKEAVAA